MRNLFAQFRRGIISAEEACEKILFCDCIDPAQTAEYMRLLPNDLWNVLPKTLAKLPTTDEEWARFNGYVQFGGDSQTWSKFILECRVNTEAVRAWVQEKAAH